MRSCFSVSNLFERLLKFGQALQFCFPHDSLAKKKPPKTTITTTSRAKIFPDMERIPSQKPPNNRPPFLLIHRQTSALALHRFSSYPFKNIQNFLLNSLFWTSNSLEPPTCFCNTVFSTTTTW